MFLRFAVKTDTLARLLTLLDRYVDHMTIDEERRLEEAWPEVARARVRAGHDGDQPSLEAVKAWLKDMGVPELGPDGGRDARAEYLNPWLQQSWRKHHRPNA